MMILIVITRSAVVQIWETRTWITVSRLRGINLGLLAIIPSSSNLFSSRAQLA